MGQRTGDGTLRRAWVAEEAGVRGGRLRVLAWTRESADIATRNDGREILKLRGRGGGILTAVSQPTTPTAP